jgi:hypothetical protein
MAQWLQHQEWQISALVVAQSKWKSNNSAPIYIEYIHGRDGHTTKQIDDVSPNLRVGNKN